VSCLSSWAATSVVTCAAASKLTRCRGVGRSGLIACQQLAGQQNVHTTAVVAALEQSLPPMSGKSGASRPPSWRYAACLSGVGTAIRHVAFTDKEVSCFLPPCFATCHGGLLLCRQWSHAQLTRRGSDSTRLQLWLGSALKWRVFSCSHPQSHSQYVTHFLPARKW